MTKKSKDVRLKQLLRLGICVALIALIAMVGAVMVSAEEPVYSEGLEFTSNGDGTCYVSGIGSCTDTVVNIPPTSPEGDAVTSIGGSAFYNCTKLANITIPEGVTSIGVSAFYNCTKLANITIPEGVTSIGTYAFYNCTKLVNITIPEGVTSIGTYAFYNCTKLANITIPEGVTSIGDKAFFGCSGLIVKENGISYVDKWAIDCETNMTNAVLRSDTVGIANGAFEDCYSLSSVTIPEGVTSIGVSAFYNCTKLANITIPEGVTSIGVSAFYNCTKLANITIPEGVTSIGYCAFSGCSSLTNITIPEGVTSIDRWTFEGCSSLANITIPEGVASIGYCAFSGCSSLTNITIPESVTSIDKGAFEGCSSLANITIPEGVTNIGGSAFRGCSALTSITIPEGVTSIGGFAFSGCSALTSITIPEGVTSIGHYAFSGCFALTSITIPEGVTSIDNSAFSGCSGLTSVTIPEGVTSIGSSAFSGCSGLTSITILEGVTSIGSSAFSGCSALTSITIPEGVTSIDDSAFSGCSSLTSITIPESVTRIGDKAFSGCSGLIVKENGISYVDKWAINCETNMTNAVLRSDTVGIADGGVFKNCYFLSSVTIPEGVTSIGSSAFSGCSGLTSVTIPKGVTSIGSSAFADCSGLTSITIPEGVTSIGTYAFCNCTKLTSIIIPEGVTILSGTTFQGCTNLSELHIPDSVSYVSSGTSVGGTVLERENGIIYWDTWVVGMYGIVTNVVIRDGTVGISDWVFECCSFESVVIPKSLRYIGDFAFDGIWPAHYIADVYFEGTKQDFNQLKWGMCNQVLSFATAHFFDGKIDGGFTITGASVTAGEALTLNYYTKIWPWSDYGNIQMRFTYHDEVYYTDGIYDEASDEYVFSFSEIPPQCMNDSVKAELVLCDWGEKVVYVKESYSIRQYCDDALAANPNNKALATLLADLLAYGDAAQDYANYNEDTPVSEGFEVAPTEWEDVTDTDFTLSDKTREELCFTAAGVRFGYVNRVYFKLKAADLTGVTLTVNGKTYTAEDLALVEDTADTYIFYTDPVYATEFDKVFTAELSVDGEVIQTLTYSVRSYVYAKQNSENTEMAALVRALYTYGRSAVAYKNEQ